MKLFYFFSPFCGLYSKPLAWRTHAVPSGDFDLGAWLSLSYDYVKFEHRSKVFSLSANTRGDALWIGLDYTPMQTGWPN